MLSTAALVSICFLSLGLRRLSDLPVSEVIFDPGTPGLSVGVIGNTLVELGDFYEGAKIMGFDQAAVIVKNMQSDDQVKCLASGTTDPKLRRKAVYLFVAKQMRAIGEAQRAYLEKFGDTYAHELEVLMRQGLVRGFKEDAVKQDYYFEISQLGKTKFMVMQGQDPAFLALASPVNPAEGDLYFSVNHLGEVRYGATLFEAAWGPVWEYNEANQDAAQRPIGAA